MIRRRLETFKVIRVDDTEKVLDIHIDTSWRYRDRASHDMKTDEHNLICIYNERRDRCCLWSQQQHVLRRCSALRLYTTQRHIRSKQIFYSFTLCMEQANLTRPSIMKRLTRLPGQVGYFDECWESVAWGSCLSDLRHSRWPDRGQDSTHLIRRETSVFDLSPMEATLDHQLGGHTLREYFNKFGEIKEAQVMKDPTTRRSSSDPNPINLSTKLNPHESPSSSLLLRLSEVAQPLQHLLLASRGQL
ncbi:hypothetical protein RRG08_033431 [Elysia crispata]|uniref:Uncharacterized protein n=1 Tax=Elysia crispata TaxID=231223 RepID=A0AAE1ATR7_9GAST|nr:hypothetical protein RRG08_033431 [Elysia crispata]